jgi:hypothetical protein
VAAGTGSREDEAVSAAAIEAVAFDVNETLFSLDRLGPAFTDVGLDPGLVPLWFARLLRDGFALTAIGGYRPFADLAAETCGVWAHTSTTPRSARSPAPCATCTRTPTSNRPYRPCTRPAYRPPR